MNAWKQTLHTVCHLIKSGVSEQWQSDQIALEMNHSKKAFLILSWTFMIIFLPFIYV